jgi:hypothetical protein
MPALCEHEERNQSQNDSRNSGTVSLGGTSVYTDTNTSKSSSSNSANDKVSEAFMDIDAVGNRLGETVIPDLMTFYESFTHNDSDDAHVMNTTTQFNKTLPPSTSLGSTRKNEFESPHDELFDRAKREFELELPLERRGSEHASYMVEANTVMFAPNPIHPRLGMNFSDMSQESSLKEKKNDRRWSKRFIWSDDLHQDFTSAIFALGLERSSPSAVLMQIQAYNPSITLDKIEAVLRRYQFHGVSFKRPNRFQMTGKNETLSENCRKDQNNEGNERDKNKHISSSQGDQICNAPQQFAPCVTIDKNSCSHSSEFVRTYLGFGNEGQCESLILPSLSDEEKRSPIGMSLSYLLGLYVSLQKQLKMEREKQNKPLITIIRREQVKEKNFPLESRKGVPVCVFKAPSKALTRPWTDTKQSSSKIANHVNQSVRLCNKIVVHAQTDKPCRFVFCQQGNQYSQSETIAGAPTEFQKPVSGSMTHRLDSSSRIHSQKLPLLEEQKISMDETCHPPCSHLQAIPYQSVATCHSYSQNESSRKHYNQICQMKVPRKGLDLKSAPTSIKIISTTNMYQPSDNNFSHPSPLPGGPIVYESSNQHGENFSQVTESRSFSKEICYLAGDQFLGDLMNQR